MANPLAQALMLPSQRDQRLLDRVRYGQGILQDATSGGPVQHWGEGLARMLKAGLGGHFAGSARREGEERDKAYLTKMAEILRSPDPMAAAGQSDDPDIQGIATQFQLQKAMEPAGERWQPLTDQQERDFGLPPEGVYLGNASGDVKSLYDAPKAAEQPSAIREYEYAVGQGYKGTYQDFITEQKRAGAPSTKVDVHAPNSPAIGAIPPGFVAVPDGKGKWTFEKIPGGPAADEAAAAAAAETAKTEKEQQTGGIVVEDIDRALKLATDSPFWTTGFVGEALSGIGGTQARDVRGLVDTVKANAGFAELQAMRDSSPTGGALGQVTERELAFLQATIGSLDQSQTPEQFQDNLRRVKNVYLDIIHGPGKGPSREGLSFKSTGAPSGTVVQDLPPGFR